MIPEDDEEEELMIVVYAQRKPGRKVLLPRPQTTDSSYQPPLNISLNFHLILFKIFICI